MSYQSVFRQGVFGEQTIIVTGGGIGRFGVHPYDIREEAMVGQTIADVRQLRGRLDRLVNNAGGHYRTAMKTISTKGFEAVVRNNLTGRYISCARPIRAGWKTTAARSRARCDARPRSGGTAGPGADEQKTESLRPTFQAIHARTPDSARKSLTHNTPT